MTPEINAVTQSLVTHCPHCGYIFDQAASIVAVPPICPGCQRNPSSLDIDVTSARRARRFYQRFFAGVRSSPLPLRLLTLTTSDKACRRDIHRDWRVLRERLKRRGIRMAYIAVVEHKLDRTHVHIVFQGNYIDQAWLSHEWSLIHESPIVDIRRVKSQGMARYLCKYLSKSQEPRPNRYWQSYDWVFKGWVGWSRLMKSRHGWWPTQLYLNRLKPLINRVELLRLCVEYDPTLDQLDRYILDNGLSP